MANTEQEPLCQHGVAMDVCEYCDEPIIVMLPILPPDPPDPSDLYKAEEEFKLCHE